MYTEAPESVVDNFEKFKRDVAHTSSSNADQPAPDVDVDPPREVTDLCRGFSYLRAAFNNTRSTNRCNTGCELSSRR